MNGVNFRHGKYMNGSCFSLGLVYEWGGVRRLQPHIRTQNHGKLPPRDHHEPRVYQFCSLQGIINNTISSPEGINSAHSNNR